MKYTLVLLLASVVPCLAFHYKIPSTHFVQKTNSAGLCGVRTISSVADAQERRTAMHLTRRNVGALAFGALSQAIVLSRKNAFAEDSALQDWKQDAINGFSNYTAGDEGIMYKDIEIGLGTPPKKGDFVRFQLSAYLLDGTLASSFAGVELSQVTPPPNCTPPPFTRDPAMNNKSAANLPF
jgi:hypothetical protein